MKKYYLLSIVFFSIYLLHAQEKPTLLIPQLLRKLTTTPKDTSLLTLLLTIADAYILKPGEEKSDLDSASLLIGQVQKVNDQRSRDPRIAGLAYLLSSKVHRERGADSLARLNAFLALDTFRRQSDPLDLAYAYVEAASYYGYNIPAEDSVRIRYYRLAIPIFDSLGKKEQQASTREILGDCLLVLDGSADALPVLLQATEIYKSIGHFDLRNIYSLLGTCYGEIGDEPRAIEYELRSIRLEEARPIPDASLITAYNRLAHTYNTLDEYENAAELYRKGLDLATRLNRDRDAWLMGMNLAGALNRSGKPGPALDTLKKITAHYKFSALEHIQETRAYVQIYVKLNRQDQLIKYGEELAATYEQTPAGSNYRIGSLVALTEYALSMHQFDRAKKYDLEAAAISRQLAALPYVVTAYKMLYRIDSARGDLGTSMHEFQQYIALRDSVNDINRARQIAGLKLEFDTEKKDRDIQSLTRRQLLGQTALRQAGIARNAIIGAAVLLLILLLMAINRYRLKQRSNRQLTRLIGEKEWLVKEVHHRVKNNLQLVMSLLNTQSFYIDDEKAQAAIRQSRNRMYAMSLIHQRLYQVESLQTIDMSRYIPELVDYIREGMEGDARITFDLVIDPLELDVAQAIPLGLILNETITNAIKHAFSGRCEGHIAIHLQEQAFERIRLLVADDGIGMADPTGSPSNKSMGRRLIETLVRQLHGNMTVTGCGGLSIVIEFLMEHQRSFAIEEKLTATSAAHF